VVPADRAVLVRLTGRDAVVAVSGGGDSAQDSAFADAVGIIRKRYRDRNTPVVVPPAGDAAGDVSLKKTQSAMGGTSILWQPLWLKREDKYPPTHALWLEKWHGRGWDRGEVDLVHHAAVFLGHALLDVKKQAAARRRLGVKLIAAALLITLLFLPVRSSVTAPSRVIPDRPHYVFAPMDGILKELLVQPGETVAKGEVVFRYDPRVLDKRLEEAYRNISVARAELAKLQGAAHRDPEARAAVPVQKLEVERAEAEADFFKQQRERAEVKTAKAGVVVLDDPDALIGSVVQTGQTVLSVADPESTKLRVFVPAGDAGFLQKGGRIEMRPDSNPLSGAPAFITRIGFDVVVSEEGVPSVLVEAIWPGDAPAIRPGQRGTAKIYGKTTRLGLQLFRKPFIALRSFIGL
jgi:multidrug resistance efflux pump